MQSCGKFEHKGHKAFVSVKTFTGEKTHTSFAVDGLKVSRTSGLDVDLFNIQKAYTKDDLPVDSRKIPTPEWKYLQEIPKEISHSYDVKVELLVGANWTRALEPVQVINSRNGVLYAMKTV